MQPAQVNARPGEKSVGDFPLAPWWLFRMGGRPSQADDRTKPATAGPHAWRAPMLPSTSAQSRRTLRISAMAAGLLASGLALADAHLDTKLLSRISQAA